MKVLPIIPVFSVLLLTSCGDSRTQNEHQPPPRPKALADKSSLDISLASKRMGGDDLVEKLYDELSDKTPALKELEKRLTDLENSQADSTAAFDKYNEKIESYYSDAYRHGERIKDSVLRVKIQTLITAGLEKYHVSVSKQKDLLKAINTKNTTLSDLHVVLKITKTLPMIETYETGNQPAPVSIEGFLKQLDATLRYADTLTKK